MSRGGRRRRQVRFEVDAQTEWNARTSHLQGGKRTPPPFMEILRDYLPRDESMTCLEVGAIPGSLLAYLHLTFGYKITGIDFASNEAAFHKTMAAYGISDYEFIKDDFLQHGFDHRFDVVASFGFIEHFDDFENVVIRHCALVAPGGWLALAVPNFRYLQFAYHFVFDRPNLRIHNQEAMDLRRLKAIASREGVMEVVSSPVGRLELWREERPLGLPVRLTDTAIRRAAAALGRVLPLSRYYSPYLVWIGRRGDVSTQPVQKT